MEQYVVVIYNTVIVTLYMHFFTLIYCGSGDLQRNLNTTFSCEAEYSNSTDVANTALKPL